MSILNKLRDTFNVTEMKTWRYILLEIRQWFKHLYGIKIFKSLLDKSGRVVRKHLP